MSNSLTERVKELEREIEELKKQSERRLAWPFLPLPDQQINPAPHMPTTPWRWNEGTGIPDPNMTPTCVDVFDPSRVPKFYETRW